MARLTAAVLVMSMIVLSPASDAEAQALSGWSRSDAPSAGAQTFLQGVDCTDPGWCVAVGYGTGGAVIETFDGSSWSLADAGNSDTTAVLSGVDCLAIDWCVAVGWYNGGAGSQTLVELWDGDTWSVVPSPNAGPTLNTLFGVSCSSTVHCVAVGRDEFRVLVETWDGTQWTIASVPTTSADALLTDVSCASAARCVAVGSALGVSGSQPLILSWNGTVWSLDSYSVTSANDSMLSGVSCPTMSECIATGFYYDTPTTSKILTARWNGAAWTTIAAKNFGSHSQLVDVSCASTNWCAAVGDVQGSTPAVEVWDGTRWLVPTIPSLGSETELTAVVCDAISSCVAVGYEHDGSGGHLPVVVATSAPAATVSVGSIAVVEGDAGAGRSVTFSVTLSEPSTQTVTVGYSIEADGSANAATPDADFRLRSGTLTFAATSGTGLSKTNRQVTATVLADGVAEGDETFRIVLADPTGGYALGNSVATATILDDDIAPAPAPEFVVDVGDFAIVEGNAGQSSTATNTVQFRAALRAPATTTTTVRVVISDGTANEGVDIRPIGGTLLTFVAGRVQSKPVSIRVIPDLEVEGDETLFVTLVDPTLGLTLGRSVGVITIVDDD